jgi:hypothetical protein
VPELGSIKVVRGPNHLAQRQSSRSSSNCTHPTPRGSCEKLRRKTVAPHEIAPRTPPPQGHDFHLLASISQTHPVFGIQAVSCLSRPCNASASRTPEDCIALRLLLAHKQARNSLWSLKLDMCPRRALKKAGASNPPAWRSSTRWSSTNLAPLWTFKCSHKAQPTVGGHPLPSLNVRYKLCMKPKPSKVCTCTSSSKFFVSPEGVDMSVYLVTSRRWVLHTFVWHVKHAHY